MLVCFVAIAAHSVLLTGDFIYKAMPRLENKPSPHMLMCDDMYLNLIRCKRVRGVPASAFVREFSETVACDDVFNMTQDRQDYIDYLGPDRMARVLEFTSDERDELIVAQAVLHFHDAHEGRMTTGLRQASWFAYTIFFGVEQALFAVGRGFGGVTAVVNSFAATRCPVFKCAADDGAP
jgi:hypothetical protein